MRPGFSNVSSKMMCYERATLIEWYYPNHTTMLEHSSSRAASTDPAKVEAAPFLPCSAECRH